MFSIDSVVKKQNVRAWGTERPDEHRFLVVNNPIAMI